MKIKIYVNSQVDHIYLVERFKVSNEVVVSRLLDNEKRFMENLSLTGDDKVLTGSECLSLDEYMQSAYGCKKPIRITWDGKGKIAINETSYGKIVVLEHGQVRLTTRMDWWHVQPTYTFENFNLFLKYIAALDIDEISYNAGWE